MEHILDELRMREERKTCIVDELEKPFLTDVIHRNQGASYRSFDLYVWQSMSSLYGSRV
jgi:hypothetical protein